MARLDTKRIRRRHQAAADPGSPTDDAEVFPELSPEELSGVFSPPSWLRDLGLMSWLLVGIAVLLATVVALLSLTETIVIPVVAAPILAAVASPLVRALERRRIPRAAGAALVFVGIAAAGVLLTIMVLAGSRSQTGDLQGRLNEAAGKLETALHNAGVGAGTA